MREISIVQLRWDDSLVSGRAWTDRDDLTTYMIPHPPIPSVGYLLSETEDHYILTQSLGLDYGAILRIPKRAVVGIEKIGVVVDPFGVEGRA